MCTAKWACGLALAMATVLCATPTYGDQARPDAAWQLYDQAFVLLAEKKQPEARALLEQLQGQFPDHPAAAQATLRLADMNMSARPGETVPEIPETPGKERTSNFARAELALMMTVNGIWFGYNVCEMLNCADSDSSRAGAAALMAGGGAGLGLSLYLTRHGITQGQAQLFNSSVTWGSWNSLLVYDNVNDGDVGAGMAAASQLGGLGLGLVLDSVWKPTSGQVALVNTTGMWTAALTAMAFGVADEEPDATTVVIISDLGLVLGGVIGDRVATNISRGRTLLIDTGGILGLLGGGLIATFGDANDASAVFAPLMIGTLAGLGVGILGTRHWDPPLPSTNARLGVVPMGHRGWGVALTLH